MLLVTTEQFHHSKVLYSQGALRLD